MNSVQLFVFLFVTFVACCAINVSAGGAAERIQKNHDLQRKYNHEMYQKKHITINDKIHHDKVITTEYMKIICPAIIDLRLKEITEYYIIDGFTREEYQEYIVRNISDAYMREVYTEKHIPTHRPNAELVIDISDIYTYQKNHCDYYFVNYKNNKEYFENMNQYKQLVHEYLTSQSNTITLETKPLYNIDHYEFQTVLCPIIKELLITNKTRLNSNKLMNKILIVQNISKEFMQKVYTEENFKGMKLNNVKLKAPSLEDIYKYEKIHCNRPKINPVDIIISLLLYIIYLFILLTIMLVGIYSTKNSIRKLTNEYLKKE
jgi:hypothetical protein